MLLFKYQKPGNLEFTMLRQGQVYFASRSELNDSNEGRPYFVLNGKPVLWRKLVEYLLQEANQSSNDDYNRICKSTIDKTACLVSEKLKIITQNKDIPLNKLYHTIKCPLTDLLNALLSKRELSELLDTIKTTINGLPQKLEETLYISSFSTCATNPTMWGHYGGAETGFITIYTSPDDHVKICSPFKLFQGTQGFFGFTFRQECNLKLMEVG
jgi:hypothetical protein